MKKSNIAKLRLNFTKALGGKFVADITELKEDEVVISEKQVGGKVERIINDESVAIEDGHYRVGDFEFIVEDSIIKEVIEKESAEEVVQEAMETEETSEVVNEITDEDISEIVESVKEVIDSEIDEKLDGLTIEKIGDIVEEKVSEKVEEVFKKFKKELESTPVKSSNQEFNRSAKADNYATKKLEALFNRNKK